MPNGAHKTCPMMPQHHQARQVRHAAEHTVHVLDIAAADMMLGPCPTHRNSNDFCHRVEQDQEDGRPYGLGRADTQAGTDEAQSGNGGVREHTLGVALRDGHEGSEQNVMAPTLVTIKPVTG